MGIIFTIAFYETLSQPESGFANRASRSDPLAHLGNIAFSDHLHTFKKVFIDANSIHDLDNGVPDALDSVIQPQCPARIDVMACNSGKLFRCPCRGLDQQPFKKQINKINCNEPSPYDICQDCSFYISFISLVMGAQSAIFEHSEPGHHCWMRIISISSWLGWKKDD